MNRRGFLSLLAAAPFVPALAKLQALTKPIAPEVVEAFAESREWSMMQVLALSTPDVVNPGRVAQLIVFPQRLFLPSRFLVSSSCREFEILSISAAGEPILEDGVSAEVFSPLALQSQLAFDAIQAGEQVVLAVVNRSEHPQQFFASMFGRTVVRS